MAWLEKSSEGESAFGKGPDERTVEELIKTSLIVVDKHAGPTSHQISQWMREIFNVNKTAHSGTLDPMVTGVLPVALGNSVKMMPVFTGLVKEYVGVMHVHREIEEDKLKEAIKKFIGKIIQTPPVKSAVARRPREREIYSFDILEMDGKDVLFRVKCQAGTYIRKLVSDLGFSLEFGAHMTELRRTLAGNFKEEQSHSLLEIKDAYEFLKDGNESYLRKMLIPIENAVDHVKKVHVKDTAIPTILNGSPLYVNGLVKVQDEIVEGENVCIMSSKNELIALGIAQMTSKGMYDKKKGIAVRTDRVIIDRSNPMPL